MEIVSTVQSSKTPVDASLMLVMSGAVLGELAFAVRPGDRVQIRPVIGCRVLGDHRLSQAVAVNSDRASFLIKLCL